MAIYRRSSRRPLIIVAIAAAVAGLVIGFIGGRATAPDLASQVQAVRAQVTPILTSLEVIRDEYPKLLTSSGGDHGGAESALARANTTLAAHATELRVVDATTTAGLQDALADLGRRIQDRVPEGDVTAAVDAAAELARRLAASQT